MANFAERLIARMQPWNTGIVSDGSTDLERYLRSLAAPFEPVEQLAAEEGEDGEVLLPGPENQIPNPSFVYGVAGGAPLGWTAGNTYRTDAGATLETKHPGEAQVEGRKGYCVVTTSGSTSAEGIDTENVILGLEGNIVTVYCWLWGTAGGEKVQLRLGSAAVGGETTVPVTLSMGWKQYSVAFAPTASGLMGFAVNTAGTFAYKWYIAAVGPSPYFDGDTSGYEWTGTPGDSVSKQVQVGYVPAWGKLLDVTTAPADALGYLAQFVGVELPVGCGEVEARQLIRAHAGFSRGTLASIKAAVERYLAPGTTVQIVERRNLADEEDAYHFIVTIKGKGIKQTWFGLKGSWEELTGSWQNLAGSEGLIRAAIEEVKPAGVWYSIILAEGTPWLDLEGSWEDLKGSWEEL